MTDKIEQTIASLVAATEPQVTPARPFRLLGQWLGVTLVSTAVLLLFLSRRADLATQLTAPVYRGELASLFLIIPSTAVAAIWLSFPDMRQRAWVLALPLVPVAAFAFLSFYRLAHPEITIIPPPEQAHGVNCALCVTVFSIIPGCWMFHILRRQATAFPVAAGMVSLLASASIGLLGLKIVEMNDSVLHLLVWHIVPMLLLGAAGGILGRKYLSW